MSFEESKERYEIAIEAFEKRTGMKEGAYVRYIGSTDRHIEGYHGSYADPRDKLDFETIYEVESVERNALGCGYDAVKLVGFEKKFERERFDRIHWPFKTWRISYYLS